MFSLFFCEKRHHFTGKGTKNQKTQFFKNFLTYEYCSVEGTSVVVNPNLSLLQGSPDTASQKNDRHPQSVMMKFGSIGGSARFTPISCPAKRAMERKQRRRWISKPVDKKAGNRRDSVMMLNTSRTQAAPRSSRLLVV